MFTATDKKAETKDKHLKLIRLFGNRISNRMSIKNSALVIPNLLEVMTAEILQSV